MCNLYTIGKGPAAIREMARAMTSHIGNLEPRDIYPDYPAPIVRHDAQGDRELVLARWGLASPKNIQIEKTGKRADKRRAKGETIDNETFARMLEMEPDAGITNVRKTDSRHWTPLLSPANRCLVPFTAFSEPGRDDEGRYAPIWFRLPGEPIGFFAGVHQMQWSGVRKMKTGPEVIDLFAFLTTKPSEPVRSVHPKAMPVILTTEEECDAWMRADWSEAKHLQRALPNGALELSRRRSATPEA